MEFTAREARLKPEYAERYPHLEAGVWETAAEIGAKVLLWQVQQQGTWRVNHSDTLHVGQRSHNGMERLSWFFAASA